MRRLPLGPTNIEVSKLGFGCVGLTAMQNRSDAIKILEHAFAEGITHFDVARAYGFGRAERILGEFLRGKRDKVTVATKFGLQPPAGIAGNRRIIDFAKKVLRPFPAVLRRAQRQAGTMVKTGVFSPQAALESLETSLRELGTDHVDLLLLHEATLADAQNPALIEVLQNQVRRGTVRCIGIASDFAKIQDADAFPEEYKVLQFNDNAVQRNSSKVIPTTKRALVTHSIFKPTAELVDAAKKRSEITRKFSAEIQHDLSDTKILGSFLLRYALFSNTSGAVLFASSNPAHITANVRSAEFESSDEKLLPLFLQFVDELFA